MVLRKGFAWNGTAKGRGQNSKVHRQASWKIAKPLWMASSALGDHKHLVGYIQQGTNQYFCTHAATSDTKTLRCIDMNIISLLNLYIKYALDTIIALQALST